jgi:hypothetical protein
MSRPVGADDNHDGTLTTITVQMVPRCTVLVAMVVVILVNCFGEHLLPDKFECTPMVLIVATTQEQFQDFFPVILIWLLWVHFYGCRRGNNTINHCKAHNNYKL